MFLIKNKMNFHDFYVLWPLKSNPIMVSISGEFLNLFSLNFLQYWEWSINTSFSGEKKCISHFCWPYINFFFLILLNWINVMESEVCVVLLYIFVISTKFQKPKYICYREVDNLFFIITCNNSLFYFKNSLQMPLL